MKFHLKILKNDSTNIYGYRWSNVSALEDTKNLFFEFGKNEDHVFWSCTCALGSDARLSVLCRTDNDSLFELITCLMRDVNQRGVCGTIVHTQMYNGVVVCSHISIFSLIILRLPVQLSSK